MLPYRSSRPSCKGNCYEVYTTETSGTISSQHFGEKFNADKVDKHITIFLHINPPNSIKYSPNVTLHFEIEKISMKHLSSGKDSLLSYANGFGLEEINENKVTKYYAPPSSNPYLKMIRLKVPSEEVEKQELDQMPGFRLSWYYSGEEVEKISGFSEDNLTKIFVRNYPKSFNPINYGGL